MFLRNLLLVVYGLSAGALIAGSFLAFLSMIGVVPRLAGLSKTISHAMLYETALPLAESWEQQYLSTGGTFRWDIHC